MTKDKVIIIPIIIALIILISFLLFAIKSDEDYRNKIRQKACENYLADFIDYIEYDYAERVICELGDGTQFWIVGHWYDKYYKEDLRS